MSEKYKPRRAQSKSRKPEMIVAAATALVVLGSGAYVALNGGIEGVGSCPSSATLVVDPDYLQLTAELADRYNATLGESCDVFEIIDTPSATVADQGLGEADAWLPEDPSWVGRAGAATGLAELSAAVVANTPLVLAYEQQVRDAMGDERQSGENLVAMLTEAKQYDAYGQPWGTIKLVEPDPNGSAVGAVGFMTMAMMLSNGEPPPTDMASSTENQMRMLAAEHRVFERVATSAEVLMKLATNPADDTVRGPAGPRTGVTTEYAVLKAVAEGAELVADHLGDGGAGVELSVVNPDENATVQDFVSWLRGDTGRAELTRLGWRVGGSAPSPDRLAAAGLPTGELPSQRPNSSEEVVGATALQAAFAQRAAVLTVLDLSWSMNTELGDSAMRRVDLVTQAAVASWADWPLGYVTGLITFQTDADWTPQIHTVVPLQDNRTQEWKTQMPLYQQGMANLRPDGGTPLYLAISTAHDYQLANYQPGKVNKIIVLTDGIDEYNTSGFTKEDLIAKLPAEPDPERPIEIIYVLISPQADYATISEIASATQGTAIWAQDPSELPEVMRQLFAG